MATPTPHNAAVEGQIAKTVLMPGDPLRAKLLCRPRTWRTLSSSTPFATCLVIPAPTRDNQSPLWVPDMGIPSIGIYSYELFNFYGVDNILRIDCAGLAPEVKLRGIVIGMSPSTDS